MPVLSRNRRLATRVISLLPSHRQPPQTIAELAEALRQHERDLTREEAIGVVTGVLAMLESLGLLAEAQDRYRSADQEPTYLLHSLRGLIEQGQSLFGGWNGQSQTLSEHITVQELLNSPAHLLQVLEQRRLALAQQSGLPTTPSRQQTVAFVLIKSRQQFDDCFLHQWDRRASQYQLIGGRVEPDETPLAAAHRELEEEVLAHQPATLRYTLQPVLSEDAPIRLMDLSRTYGALTDYTFYAYFAKFEAPALQLGPQDRWVSITEMLSAGSGALVAPPTSPALSNLGNAEIGILLDQNIAGGLAGLPLSFPFRLV